MVAAIDGLYKPQVTHASGCVDPSAKVPTATNLCVVPSGIEAPSGEIVTKFRPVGIETLALYNSAPAVCPVLTVLVPPARRTCPSASRVAVCAVWLPFEGLLTMLPPEKVPDT